MSLETFLLFLPACFALNMAPGPNNLLSIANGTRHGFMKACLAGTGRLAAFTGMIALAASGLAAILQASEMAFHGIRIAGGLYLFYLAARLWHAEPAAIAADTRVAWAERLAARGEVDAARQLAGPAALAGRAQGAPALEATALAVLADAVPV